MKAGARWMMQVAVLVFAITACTVRTSDERPGAGADRPQTGGTGDGDGVGGGGGGGGGESPSSDASADTSSSVSTTPPELTGASWTWTTSGGAHQLTFATDGGYASDVFLAGHPGDSCGTEYFTHREGAATFQGTTLTLASTKSTRTKKDSCAGKVLAQDAIDEDVTTYAWRLDGDDAGVRALLLTSPDGSERSFLRD